MFRVLRASYLPLCTKTAYNACSAPFHSMTAYAYAAVEGQATVAGSMNLQTCPSNPLLIWNFADRSVGDLGYPLPLKVNVVSIKLYISPKDSAILHLIVLANTRSLANWVAVLST